MRHKMRCNSYFSGNEAQTRSPQPVRNFPPQRGIGLGRGAAVGEGGDRRGSTMLRYWLRNLGIGGMRGIFLPASLRRIFA